MLAFYGDDFTGSTDALEFICRAGAKAVLFIEPPTIEQLNSFPGLDAYGVAGKTRSLDPAAMEKILIPAFEKMKVTGAKHIHYKVCSTFDSSSTVGSIGKAIDCGAKVFNNKFIPVLGGMPALGRYCVFGNLFAKMGIGSNGKIYRIDKHPSMSKHPVTPMDEADLRVHLGKQTKKKIGLIDNVQQEMPEEEWFQHIADEEVLLLDVMEENQLLKIGEWLNAQQNKYGQLFSVGGSGIEMALGNYWNKEGVLKPLAKWKPVDKAETLLVVSGSCSPVTAAQITYAKANGFEEMVLDAVKTCDDDVVDVNVIKQVNQLLSRKKNIIVHTGEKQTANLSSEKLGTALGVIAKEAAINTGVRRVVIAGGDTSSYAARAMGVDAVEMIGPLVIGAPLCKAYSKNEKINGLEVNFKGGQVGAEDYFVLMRDGLRTESTLFVE
ncbi:MAG TPA: four-carbon acid sugar kinase family protein [Chitinophagaceae bacterium]